MVKEEPSDLRRNDASDVWPMYCVRLLRSRVKLSPIVVFVCAKLRFYWFLGVEDCFEDADRRELSFRVG